MTVSPYNNISALVCATARLPKATAEPSPRGTEAELARRMAVTIVDYSHIRDSGLARNTEKALRFDYSLAKFGLSRLNGHNVVLSSSEKVGIPLLSMLRTKGDIPHVMIAHHPLSPLKFNLLKSSGLLRHLSMLICLSRQEEKILQRHSGLPPEKIRMVEGVGVDHNFFRPCPGAADGFVLSVGATSRDYQTLLNALGDTAIPVVIAAGSRWVKGPCIARRLPSNFRLVTGQSAAQMRDLYARCALVVVPLSAGTQHSAGRTTVAEAMASAKPLVATDLPGMRDYIEPAHNGLLVPVGDAAALRGAVLLLLGDPKRAAEMGLAGRSLAEKKWNVEVYADFLSRLLCEAAQKKVGPAKQIDSK